MKNDFEAQLTCATPIDGSAAAATLRRHIAEFLRKNEKITPKLLILNANASEDASRIYISNKIKAANEVGICAHIQYISEDAFSSPALKINLNKILSEYDAAILQLPVAPWCDAQKILSLIPPEKDVDGLTQVQVGKRGLADPSALLPCTPRAIVHLLETYNLDKGANKRALVIGRSQLVGRPISELLLQKDWTVTTAHSKTAKEDLINNFAAADLVICAAGQPELISAADLRGIPENLSKVIIDVSINRTPAGKLCGDLSEEFKQQHSAFYTPVPGGVGPMTVAMLMYNTVKAAIGQKELVL